MTKLIMCYDDKEVKMFHVKHIDIGNSVTKTLECGYVKTIL